MASTINASTSTGLVSTADTSGVLQLQTGGTAAVTVNASQNVGIGTASPVSALTLTNAKGLSWLNASGNFSTTAGSQIVKGADNNLYYDSYDGSAVFRGASFAERMRLDSSGNLGLGVTPSAWSGGPANEIIGLSLWANATNGGYLVQNAYYNGSNWIYKTTSQASYYLQGTGSHYWYNAPSGTAGNAITFTQAMTLSAAGNLQVPAMYATTVTTPRNVFIDSSGNMGGISSVRASKTNITALDTANWIYQLNPVTFNYRKKDEEGAFIDEFEEEQQFGLIAEDVETVKPELCIYVDDKLQGVHYDRMIAPLIKALQEQQAIIQSLTDRVAQLEAK